MKILITHIMAIMSIRQLCTAFISKSSFTHSSMSAPRSRAFSSTTPDKGEGQIVFKYFSDPINFSCISEEMKECTICKKVGIGYDGYRLYGCDTNEKDDRICMKCMDEGELLDLDLTTNWTLRQGTDTQSIQIEHQTPDLPTWGDMEWPYSVEDEDYYIFEKIASKPDFSGKEEFINSFSEEDQELWDLNDIWECFLVDTPITNLMEKRDLDVSIYLFTTRKGKKYCRIDAK